MGQTKKGTTGTNGDVSFIWLPGYIYGYFTGLGIYYPDGTPNRLCVLSMASNRGHMVTVNSSITYNN